MPTQPNIILILTDHFRRDALGTSTPNLMALAKRGVRFANAYSVSPLCQPARNTIVTGMLPTFTGICGNQSDAAPAELRDDTFMHRLRGAGYHTALVGKHHYIDRYGIGMDVTEDDAEIRRYGFDEVLQVVDDGENGHNDDAYTRWLGEKGKLEEFRRELGKPVRGNVHPFEEDETADGFIGRNGIRFVEDYEKDQPFYLNLSFIGPHPPFWHPGELQHDPGKMNAPVGVADTDRIRNMRAHYMDKVALIDRYVAELVQALEKRGLLENTVIIFTSDHGDCLGDFGIVDKRYFYEGSAGVPFFMCGPGVPHEERKNGPRVSRMLISHLDLYPTVCALAGAENPRDKRRSGCDIVAMLKGDAPGHTEIIGELATEVMVRTGNWKLVYDPEQGGVQNLYNLARDPNEEENLAGGAGYENVTLDLVRRLLDHKVRQTQSTHIKEEQRLQRVHIPG